MVSPEEVRNAYRLLLGREPENEKVVLGHAAHFSSVAELRTAMIKSPEFQSKVLGQTVARPKPPPALPARPATEVCQFGIPIRILEPNPADGNVSLFELIILNHLVAQRAPKVVFELGTFDGRTTINFAANTPLEARIYTIDLPRHDIDQAKLDLHAGDRKYIDKEVSGVRFINTTESNKITQLFGDTAAFNFSCWNGQVDFVFVDASHAAPYVRNDTEVALKLIGDRSGLIAWHDYNGSWPALTEVIDEFRRTDPRLKNLAYVAGTSVAFCEMLG